MLLNFKINQDCGIGKKRDIQLKKIKNRIEKQTHMNTDNLFSTQNKKEYKKQFNKEPFQ